MAIDRLSSTAALIAALRSDASRKGAASSRSSASSLKPSARPAAQARPAIAQLRRELIELVRHVSLDDPVSIRQARPRMIRAILLWEFGPGLREHPEWTPMMDSIVQSIEADPAQEVQFAALISELKAK